MIQNVVQEQEVQEIEVVEQDVGESPDDNPAGGDVYYSDYLF